MNAPSDMRAEGESAAGVVRPSSLPSVLARSAGTEVVLAGDWHSNRLWAMQAFDRISRLAPDARVVLQLGDFNIGQGLYSKAFLNQVNASCVARKIEALLITPGNHDDWGRLANRRDWIAGDPARLHDRVWALPRGYRFELGDRTFLAVGGAASLDRFSRQPGVDWWPEEVGDPTEYDAIAEAGQAEVMLTHEAVDGATPVTQFIDEGRNPQGWPAAALAESARSRQLTTQLWQRVGPEMLFHGHMHVQGEGVVDGHRVVALACDDRKGNLGALRLNDLGWRWLSET